MSASEDKGLQSRWSFVSIDENPTVADKIREKSMAMVESLAAIGVCITELKLKFLDLKRDLNHKIEAHKRAKAKAKKPTIRYFTSNPELELASRNPELYRQQVDTQHHKIFRQLAGPELFQSPIVENPTRILCTGPGTVSWAIDVATRYPQAEVLCLESEPFRRLMPHNCSVEVMDIREYAPDDGWDLVYIRCTRAAVYWPRVLRRAQYITKIGGWVEMVDLERETPVCTCANIKKCVTNWHCHVCEVFPADAARQTYMQTSGFEDVRLIQRLKGSVPNTYAVGSTTLLGRLMERPSSPLSRHDSVMEAD